jgi:predicted permease
MPPHFDLPAGAEVWVPMRLALDTLPLDQQLQGMYTFIARLRSGVSLEQADADVRAVARALADEHPARRGWTYRLVGLRHQLLGDIDGRTTRAIGVLLAAVGLLLAICCVNVANLLLLRVVDRERETAVRLAIGASSRQVAAERFVESAVIGVAGAAGGVVVAMWLAPLLSALNPIRADAFGPLLTDFRIDRDVLILTLLMAAVATAVFALGPGMRAGHHANLARILLASGQRAGQDPAHSRRLRLLVGTQIAVAVVLLVGSGLLVRSFVALNALDLGFRTDASVAVQLTLPVDRYADHRRRAAAMDELVAAVRSVPGVIEAAVTTNIPLQRGSFDSYYTVDGRPPVLPTDVPITAHRVVTPEYLPLIGVRLRQGRLLLPSDDADATPVVVITEELARQAWPNQDPLGRRIRRGRAEETRPWLTVVGVVADVKEDRYNFRIDRAAWYLPYAQENSIASPNLVIRTTADPSVVGPAIRSSLRGVDPDIGASELVPLDRHVSEILTTERFAALLLAALAAAGLLLAALGLYGAISHLVLSRRPEIALRIAVGAARSRVIGMVIREVAAVVCGGLIVGSLVALAGGRVLTAVLHGVSHHDAATYAGVALLVAMVSALAAVIPAMRAAAVDPARLLR